MHAALLREGIKVSPRTCGRIMAKHRALYGWEKPKGPAKPKKEMPFNISGRGMPCASWRRCLSELGPGYVRNPITTKLCSKFCIRIL